MKRHPEAATAVLNGLLVLVVPMLLALGAWFDADSSNTGVTVRPPGASAIPPLMQLVPVAAALIPFAIVAAWRTEVHARRWLDEGVAGWRGVAEAGALALGIALCMLAPGIVTRPLEAPPYVAAYGGGALICGLLIGLLLRTTALLFLRLVAPGDLRHVSHS